MTRPTKSRQIRAQRKEVRRAKEWEAVRSLEYIETEPDDLSTWLSDPAEYDITEHNPLQCSITKEAQCAHSTTTK